MDAYVHACLHGMAHSLSSSSSLKPLIYYPRTQYSSIHCHAQSLQSEKFIEIHKQKHEFYSRTTEKSFTKGMVVTIIIIMYIRYIASNRSICFLVEKVPFVSMNTTGLLQQSQQTIVYMYRHFKLTKPNQSNPISSTFVQHFCGYIHAWVWLKVCLLAYAYCTKPQFGVFDMIL